MKAFLPSVIALAALASFADGPVSDPACVYLRPEASFFWHTATNSTLTLPVEFPAGSTTADLTVSGVAYHVSYPGITTNEFLLELPPATSPETENVYDLTLVFDNGLARHARLGLVRSFAAGSEGTTRCIAPFGSARWRKVDRCAVMPIPFGVTSFLLQFEDGSEVSDTGLDGAAGWYALAFSRHKSASLAMTDADGAEWTAALNGVAGTVVQLR